MTRRPLKFFLATCFLLLLGGVSYAQTAACTRALARAEEAFDQGRLQDVLEILDKKTGTARDCAFTKDERIRAEKLLTKVYIFTDNVVEAENSLIDLLREDKEHQLAKDDPSELHFLYSQFKTEPIFRVAIRAGVNTSSPTILQTFNTFQEGDKAYNGNGFGIGFNFEGMIERHIKKGIEVGLGAQYRIVRYNIDGNFITGSTALSYEVANQSEAFRVPLLARYNFNYDKRNLEGQRLNKMFYVFGGASFDLITNAKYVGTSRSGGTAFTLIDENEINSLTEFDQVATTNVSVFAGAGVRIRVGREKVDFLSFEARYDNSLFNYINPENRFANQRVNFDIGHVEDDLTINTISISVGYTRSFYKPTKRKQYR